MKAFATTLVCSLALILGGCFQNKSAIKVNPDGSGTITVTTQMKTSAIKQMKEMAKAFGGDNAKEPELFTEKEAKDNATKMGEGLEYVSSEPIKTPDYEGIKAVYSFKDISKVKINEMTEPPGGGGPGGPKPKKSTPVTFKFEKLANGNSLLTILNPGCEQKFDAPSPAAPPQDLPEEQLGMMKEMMGGLKVSIFVEVGKLVKTNSKHAEGSTITILEMDFDKIMNDTAKFKKLIAAQPKSPEDAKALMKDFPGVKMNLEPETTIEYSGN